MELGETSLCCETRRADIDADHGRLRVAERPTCRLGGATPGDQYRPVLTVRERRPMTEVLDTASRYIPPGERSVEII